MDLPRARGGVVKHVDKPAVLWSYLHHRLGSRCGDDYYFLDHLFDHGDFLDDLLLYDDLFSTTTGSAGAASEAMTKNRINNTGVRTSALRLLNE